MKKLGIYYFAIILIVGLGQFSNLGAALFPKIKYKTPTFPQPEERFSTQLPILKSGAKPRFPDSKVILNQPNLFAPFVILNNIDLSKKNLSKAHLSFADLRNANLKGADLSNAILYGANLKGSLFDSATTLPFTKSTALDLGMVEQE